jgi:hypothetical protein
MIIKSQRIKRALLTALADEEMLKITVQKDAMNYLPVDQLINMIYKV